MPLDQAQPAPLSGLHTPICVGWVGPSPGGIPSLPLGAPGQSLREPGRMDLVFQHHVSLGVLSLRGA